MCDLATIWHAQKKHQEAFTLMSKAVGLSETASGFDHPHTIGRKQTLDEWASEAHQYPQAGDVEGARQFPHSHDTSTLGHERLAEISQVATESTHSVDRAAKYTPYSGIRKSSSRRRDVLDSIEKSLANRDKTWQGVDKKARQIRDLLIEYGIDWSY